MKELHLEIRSYKEFIKVQQELSKEVIEHRNYEDLLFSGKKEFYTKGFCSICDSEKELKVDLNWGNGIVPNWRERLECSCGCNNRVRAAFGVLKDLVSATFKPKIYATEQVTSFFNLLKSKYTDVIGSEFLRDGTPGGKLNPQGIRHEDLTQLTFQDNAFDLIASFDVLEHVPDFTKALSEIARVLKPSGYLLASFPFDSSKESTEVRARISSNGEITHILPPEYHGDPIDGSGCLCFQVFGWDILDTMKTSGFSDAYTLFYWSKEKGYLGPNQLIIIARK